MSFVTDDLVKFIVFVLPREVKVYTLFGINRDSGLKSVCGIFFRDVKNIQFEK